MKAGPSLTGSSVGTNSMSTVNGSMAPEMESSSKSADRDGPAASIATAARPGASMSRLGAMPTFLLTNEMVDALGIPRDELRQRRLSLEAIRVVEEFLARHGFDVTRAIYVRELANAEGFFLAQ
jgi:hypothetical protein